MNERTQTKIDNFWIITILVQKNCCERMKLCIYGRYARKLRANLSI